MLHREVEFTRLFKAFMEARESFDRLRLKGLDRSDHELARDPDYLAFHRAGVVLGVVGGGDAVSGAMRCFSDGACGEADVVRRDLLRLWNGMGQWRH